MVPQTHLKGNLEEVGTQAFVIRLNSLSHHIESLSDLDLKFFILWGVVNSIFPHKLKASILVFFVDPNDAFGQHLATSGRFDDEVDHAVLLDEASKYYANILTPFDSLVERKIKEALDRIEDGTFGTCESCGKPISEKRLMARPMTTQCIDCKTEDEQKERLERLRGTREAPKFPS